MHVRHSASFNIVTKLANGHFLRPSLNGEIESVVHRGGWRVWAE